MNPTVRLIVHSLLLVLGILLLAGGIMTGKHGATVVGIVVSAATVQQYLRYRRTSHPPHATS